MTNDDRNVFICFTAVASFYMIYSSIKYSLRLREWEKIDGTIVNCDGTLAGDDFVYQLSIKIKIDCKEEIVSLSNEFGKRNIGESVQILRSATPRRAESWFNLLRSRPLPKGEVMRPYFARPAASSSARA